MENFSRYDLFITVHSALKHLLFRSLSGVARATPDASHSQPTAYCFMQ